MARCLPRAFLYKSKNSNEIMINTKVAIIAMNVTTGSEIRAFSGEEEEVIDSVGEVVTKVGLGEEAEET
jgi:hypothetical protein